tara:strand:+ start:592 stop:1086 length:495 start_codon:yes stop_codon:yes gene_type:complete
MLNIIRKIKSIIRPETGITTVVRRDIESLISSLESIDKKIIETSNSLIEVQSVSFRAALSRNNGLISKIQETIYGDSLRDSTIWYRNHLQKLRSERKFIQSKLDKLTGQFWKKRIKRWIKLLTLLLLIMCCSWIFFMGLVTAIYFSPIWGALLLIYFYTEKRKL